MTGSSFRHPERSEGSLGSGLPPGDDAGAGEPVRGVVAAETAAHARVELQLGAEEPRDAGVEVLRRFSAGRFPPETEGLHEEAQPLSRPPAERGAPLRLVEAAL